MLTLKQQAVSIAFGTVSFFMADDNRTVRVDVSQDLLARIDGPPASKSGYVERLMRHQRQFAQIAAAKYDEGQYEAEVQVLVVRIEAHDLID